MPKKPADNRFQTHIREPRWQQIISIVIVVIIVVVELVFVLRRR